MLKFLGRRFVNYLVLVFIATIAPRFTKALEFDCI